MENDERLDDDVVKWLEEGPPPDPDVTFDDIVEERKRQFRGNPNWFEQDVPESEALLPEHPATARRRKAREFSERWGWIFDLSSALYWYARSWFTTDVMLGLFRASYGLLMVGLLLGIIYSVFYATKNGPRIRTLPTIEELQQPARQSGEGSPHPKDGKQ